MLMSDRNTAWTLSRSVPNRSWNGSSGPCETSRGTLSWKQSLPSRPPLSLTSWNAGLLRPDRSRPAITTARSQLVWTKRSERRCWCLARYYHVKWVQCPIWSDLVPYHIDNDQIWSRTDSVPQFLYPQDQCIHNVEILGFLIKFIDTYGKIAETQTVFDGILANETVGSRYQVLNGQPI